MPAAIRLRPVRGTDSALLFAWRQEDETKRYNPLEPVSYAEFLERRVLESGDLTDHTVDTYRYMIDALDSGEPEPVGSVSLKSVSRRMGLGELGYALTASAQGQGYGTAAVRAWIALIFEHTTLERLFALVAAENLASCKLLERLGFTREGCLRQHYVIEGRRVDEVFYGLMRSEWKSSS